MYYNKGLYSLLESKKLNNSCAWQSSRFPLMYISHCTVIDYRITTIMNFDLPMVDQKDTKSWEMEAF